MNTTDALSTAILALNTLLEPDATSAESGDWLGAHAGEAVETLCRMRDEQRESDLFAAAATAATLVHDGMGDQLVVVPAGTDAPGVRVQDGQTSIAAADLLSHLLAEHWRLKSPWADEIAEQRRETGEALPQRATA